jgi:NADH-quinone oxidoreductase subunit N
LTGFLAAAVTNPFPSPSIDYAGISPMLVVFGFAVVGVVLEAFLPARLRPQIQLPVALLGLVGGFIAVIALAGAHRLAAEKAVAVDGPTLFLQGTILALAFASLLLVGERSFDEGGGSFVGQASAVPGTAD